MSAIRVKSNGGTFSTVSGRVGDFVFRVCDDSTMLVFYRPKKKKGEGEVSTLSRHWLEDDSVMARFREMIKMFGLKVVKD